MLSLACALDRVGEPAAKGAARLLKPHEIKDFLQLVTDSHKW
jgi:hypothetical protein